MRRRFLGVPVVVVLVSGVAVAGATPPSGVSRTDHARATISAPVSASARGESEVAGQMVTVPPGGAIAWHSHPGPNFVAVKSGTLTVHAGGTDACTTTSYPAANGYLEHVGMVHSAQNDGAAPAELYVTQVGVPVGAELRKAEANPGKANCPDVTGPAPTVTNIVRAKLSEPFDVPSTVTSDVMMQTVVIEPGGTVGWHSHASPTFVAVKSGTVTFYRSTASRCTAQNYSAGQAYVEPVNEPHMGRNEGTTPVELYATYLAVPVGGPLRAEHEEPTGAGCPGASSPQTSHQAIAELPRTGPPAGLLIALACGLIGTGCVARRLTRR
jgi:quercetin dioxygenase-like cupin family protein